MKVKLLLVLMIVICLANPVKAQTSPEDTTLSIVNTDLVISNTKRIKVYPYAYYTPEIKLAFGAGGIITLTEMRVPA